MNSETDKREGKDKSRLRKISTRKLILNYTLYCCEISSDSSTDYSPEVTQSDSLLQGYGYKMGSALFSKWERKYFVLYPNRLQWSDSFSVSVCTQSFSYLYCVWFFRGNFVGQRPYMTGNQTCSACPDDKPFCYNNLCSESHTHVHTNTISHGGPPPPHIHTCQNGTM